MKAAVLYSGGKDSTYALYWALQNGYDVKRLLVFIPKRDSMIFHEIPKGIGKIFEKAIGIPTIEIETKGKDREALELGIKKLSREGIELLITGGLASNFQKKIFSGAARKYGINTLAPAWGEDPENYMREIVKIFKFTIIKISSEGIPHNLLGKIITGEDVEDLIRRSKIYGFNPAFEGGEAETLVLSSPVHKKKIVLRDFSIEKESEYYAYLIIKRIELFD